MSWWTSPGVLDKAEFRRQKLFFFSFLYWIFSVFSLNKQLQIYIYIAISNGYISLKQLYMGIDLQVSFQIIIFENTEIIN